MAQLPSGTVTFLFTDIEGSTQLWEKHPEAMEPALARHDALLRAAIESHGGHVFSRGGDSFHAAFGRASSALAAAADAQLALAEEPWPPDARLLVRMAVHTGETGEREGDYVGPTLNRTARLRSIAHGGQTVVSQAGVQAMGGELPPGTSLRDLGPQRLRDLSQPERVYQLLRAGLRSDFPPLGGLDRFPNNLPVQLTSLIGRESEVGRVKQLVPVSRLLTLTGVGGCGKTRLALQLAADLLDDYPDGAWLVELAPVTDPLLVTQSVASSLGLREEPSRGLLDTLTAYLAGRTVLLLLDNCEHLIEPCARLAEHLLRSCPGLRILATSREALGVGGELTFPVPSLAQPETVPETVAEEGLHALSSVAAVQLFLDRASLTKPTFRLTVGNAPAVVDTCRRLDGIPLALELAAARVRLLPVEQIRHRLDDRFRLLSGGSRTALPRQQTLRAAIDWSHDLLDDAERILFRRLAVFRGGWSLSSAEAVCSSRGIEEGDVLDLLGRLVDKSLAVADEYNGTGRYRMLQTIHQYAAEQLATSGEHDAVRDRHLEQFLGFAEAAQRELRGAHQALWLDRLEAERDNLRAASDWACAQDDPDRCLRLARALWRFWYVRGHWAEGERALAALLAHPVVTEGTDQRAEVLKLRANLLFVQGDLDGATGMFQEALEIKRGLRDRRGVAACLNNLGIVAAQQGDLGAARALYGESLGTLRDLGDELGVSDALNNLAGVAADEGDLETARQLYEESLEIGRRHGNLQAVANALNNLGEVARAGGDLDRARRLCEESFDISRSIGDQRLTAMAAGNLGAIALGLGDLSSARELHEQSLVGRRRLGHKLGLADSLEAFAMLEVAESRHTKAARLIGAAETAREAIGAPIPEADREPLETAIAACRRALDESASAGAVATGRGFDAAIADGRALALDEAVAYALGEVAWDRLRGPVAERLAANETRRA